MTEECGFVSRLFFCHLLGVIRFRENYFLPSIVTAVSASRVGRVAGAFVTYIRIRMALSLGLINCFKLGNRLVVVYLVMVVIINRIVYLVVSDQLITGIKTTVTMYDSLNPISNI